MADHTPASELEIRDRFAMVALHGMMAQWGQYLNVNKETLRAKVAKCYEIADCAMEVRAENGS